MKYDLARELFKSFKSAKIRRSSLVKEETERANGDPAPISELINQIVSDRNWNQGVAEGNLFSDWEKIVGQEIASHTLPISTVDGKLMIKCSSTAWANQMRLMQQELLTTIRNSAPGALIEELIFLGPNAPKWRKGLRSIKGARGPRDTYG
jgi:predicted nucleic acid-binding Zn ribbon protein